MLTVDDYGAIRRAHRDGMSINAIARSFHHSRYKVREILHQAGPVPQPRTRNRPAPVLGPLHAIIDQILADDEQAPPKQRHTARQVFRRLSSEHGYTGCYGQVQRFLLKHRRRHRETFIPLAHPPGHRLEADFGHIHVDFPDGRRLIPFLVTVWSYSNAPFVMAMPTERTEAVLAGMVAAFDFFGAVPREVWWDNPRTVAKFIYRGRQRELHPRYAALASHYAFDPRFCLPAHGQEKPDAESTVKAVQRRFATPVPRVVGLDEFNDRLRRLCLAERDRIVESMSGPFRIADRFTEECAVAGGLPRRPFDPCIERPAVAVDKYQTVAFEGNRYSVPRDYAYSVVTVKGYVDRVVIVAEGQVVASHRRHYERCAPVLDPLHYVLALGRRPAALDHAPVFRDWPLPARLLALRTTFEERSGTRAGTRQFIRVLELLNAHPQVRLVRAIEDCAAAETLGVEAIIERVQALAATEASLYDTNEYSCVSQDESGVHVPAPDLGRFNRLLDDPRPADASSQSNLTA